MLEQTDTRAARRDATVERILKAAWKLARRDGLTEFNLRDLADAVGMRAPSLYSYFDSKFALYDAMFAQGNQQLLAELPVRADGESFEDFFRRNARFWVAWGPSDPVRYQLLFQRTIAGFEPTAESYSIAKDVYQRMVDAYVEEGFDDPADMDLWTAITSGLASQQLANDPGGDRYIRLVDDAVDMFLAHIRPKRKKKEGKR